MDNRRIDLTLQGKTDFELAMKLACSAHNGIAGWSIYESESENKKVKFKHLVFHWCIPGGSAEVNKFPFAMNTQQATEFAWGWLEKEPVAYGQPDHDGDNDK